MLSQTAKTLMLKPRLSEKTYRLSEETNSYVFDVPKNANRQIVKLAVEQQFSVAVKSVNIHVVKGKTQRSISRRGQQRIGQRIDTKRAYVTLKQGDKIAMFEEA